ncbi:hypothetical protein LCM4573_10550 [Rhizobium sp. LCM 4573]|nr:hypothetical protein LCM4573_10550 [Rhizobium sp. LCM 4573]
MLRRLKRRNDDFATDSVDPWISEAISNFEREMDRVPTTEKRGYRNQDAGNTRTAGGDNSPITHCM